MTYMDIYNFISEHRKEIIEKMFEAEKEAAACRNIEAQVILYMDDCSLDIRSVPQGDNSWIPGTHTIYRSCYVGADFLDDWADDCGIIDAETYIDDNYGDLLEGFQDALDGDLRDILDYIDMW